MLWATAEVTFASVRHAHCISICRRKRSKRFPLYHKNYDGAGGKLTIDASGEAIKDFQLTQIKNSAFVPYEV